MLIPLILATASVIKPSDPRVAYVGRFDRRDSDAPVCEWSASEVRIAAKGATVKADIEDKPGAGFGRPSNDYIEVIVDGKQAKTLALTTGASSYTIDLGSPGTHDVEFVKRTEPFVGSVTYHGFEADGFGKARPKKRHIEFVGDSITCGLGNEGTPNGPFSLAMENAYMSYASIAGRAVDADVTLIAWSGRTMYPTNTTPEIYDLVLPTQPQPTYDFRGPAPAAFVINLSTNDFFRNAPQEQPWTAAYEAFIRRVWTHYPKAQIYVTIGGMLSDNFPPGKNALTTVRGYLTRMLDRIHDPRVHFVEFDAQSPTDGIGGAFHPNVKTDQRMADKLDDALRRDLHW